MVQSLLDQMSYEQRYLVDNAMLHMDRHYDADMHLLLDTEDPTRHNTRGSGHYAVGLLLRNAPGDKERACDLLNKVIDLQFDFPDEIYHGTFKTSPQAIQPPAGNYPWKAFGPGLAYFLADTFDKVSEQFKARMLADGQEGIEVVEKLQAAYDQILPPVWKSYDPNWREFIACTFAVILDNFEQLLPEKLVARMDDAMVKTVGASIDRRLSDAIPMNSNIELMHLFISHYFGHRFGNEDWISHANREADKFHAAFMEFGSLAEFNTTTYYGVDITVLGLWRKYGKSDSFKQIGREVEKGLWEAIALFYNPRLENLSGPFARAYEMEMLAHSSMGVFLFLLLGKGYEHLAGINCESEHDPIISLVGVDIPADVQPLFKSHEGDRLVEKPFRELCERDKPGESSNLCIARAWIEENLMIGAMSGSKNTNGQMHPATIHWRYEGEMYYLRLIRREVGKGWNTHLRGITFEANVTKDQLTVEVQFDTSQDIEVYFEISGPQIISRAIMTEVWELPGLICTVEAEAPTPAIVQTENAVEIIYSYNPRTAVSSRMSFDIRLAR